MPLFLSVTIAAIADSINPCAISVLLLTVGFLFSLNKDRNHILRIGFVYIAAIYVIYVSIGLGILQALTIFGIPRMFGKFGALFIIAAGAINIINHYFPKFPIKLKIPENAHPQLALFIQKATVPSAIVLGFLVGLYEFPCTGGPYLMILGLLHDKTTFTQGLGYLLYYNLIFVSPLIAILWFASQKTLYEKVKAFRKDKMDKIGIWDGLVMVILGMIILFI